PWVSFRESVTLDERCINQYRHAVADVTDELASDADSPSRRRLAEAAAHGGGEAAWSRVDSAGDYRDYRALSVARARDPVIPWRGNAAAGRPDRDHDGRPGRGTVSQSARGRIPGGHSRRPPDHGPNRPAEDRPPRFRAAGPVPARRPEA